MPRIIATIGAPRSGKSSLALKFDPNYFVTCTFDDFRETLFPPHRRIYWKVREGPNGDKAQALLHDVKYSAVNFALDRGFNVLVPDTHVESKYADPLKHVASLHGVTIEWLVLEVPWEVLEHRNRMSDESQGHKVPDEVLKSFYDKLWAEDAWWRSEPNVKILPWRNDKGELYLPLYTPE